MFKLRAEIKGKQIQTTKGEREKENKRKESSSIVPEWNDAGAGDCVPNP